VILQSTILVAPRYGTCNLNVVEPFPPSFKKMVLQVAKLGDSCYLTTGVWSDTVLSDKVQLSVK